VESAALQTVSRRARTVVALGGGTYVDPANRAVVEDSGFSVFLDAPLEALIERIPIDGSRPLFSGAAQVADLYRQRRPSYRMASATVETRAMTPDQVADRVIELLDEL
jgi:shikimate kinase